MKGIEGFYMYFGYNTVFLNVPVRLSRELVLGWGSPKRIWSQVFDIIPLVTVNLSIPSEKPVIIYFLYKLYNFLFNFTMEF